MKNGGAAHHTMKALRIMESRKMRRPLEKGQAEGQGSTASKRQISAERSVGCLRITEKRFTQMGCWQLRRVVPLRGTLSGAFGATPLQGSAQLARIS